MVENTICGYIQKNQTINQGFLGGAKWILSIRSTSRKASRSNSQGTNQGYEAPRHDEAPLQLLVHRIRETSAGNFTSEKGGIDTLIPPPTNMEVPKGPFQEESQLSNGVCALPCWLVGG